jgi:mannose/fructose/N-acetylgalactosamine-specific phosphotransferase system component IID
VTPAAVAAQAGQDGLILGAFVLLVALAAALVVALYWRHTNGR